MKETTTVWPGLRIAACACLLLFAACGEERVAPWAVGQELEEVQESTAPAFSMLLTCSVDVAGGTMNCDPSDGPTGAANGPQMNLIVGSQHRFVRMSNDAPVVEDGVWSANVTVRNLTLQPFGTLDGQASDAAGVRIFFVDEPNNGAEVSNPDGTDNFLGGEPATYYRYGGGDLGGDGILSQGEVSEAKRWEFELNGATEFRFSVLVSTVVPEPTAIGVHITRVSAGGNHACGDGDDGRGYCWGWNFYGQLGDGTNTSRPTPVAVQAPAGVVLSGVSAGNSHTCAHGSDGKSYCWGRNGSGQLGDGRTADSNLPVIVAGTR